MRGRLVKLREMSWEKKGEEHRCNMDTDLEKTIDFLFGLWVESMGLDILGSEAQKKKKKDTMRQAKAK